MQNIKIMKKGNISIYHDCERNCDGYPKDTGFELSVITNKIGQDQGQKCKQDQNARSKSIN